MFLLWLLVHEVSSGQSFSSQPGDVTARLGTSLSLPCTVVGRRGQVGSRQQCTELISQETF